MNPFRPLSRIGLLMIFSQLALTLFVIKWLQAQYGSEKDTLREDLFQQVAHSQEQVMDSMLVTTLINPMLDDPKGFKIKMEINTDDTMISRTPPSVHEESDIVLSRHPGPKGTSAGDSGGSFNQKITIRRSPDQKKDLLMHGVRLMYKEVASLPRDSAEAADFFYTKTDSALFKKLLSENLAKKGLKFKMQWTHAKEGDSLEKKGIALYFESNPFPTSYGMLFSHFDFYLLKKITPQICFGLILLLLTGASFFISYKSLSNQMKLAEIKKDFISNISHELKTPVSTVKVAIEALQDQHIQRDPKVVSEYLDMASMEMSRLELLINKVLTTSMLENSGQLVNPAMVNLKSLIDDVLSSLQIRFNQSHASVSFESTGETIMARLDHLHIQGVLMNLLDNSLKYAMEKPVIRLSLSQRDHRIQLTVSDNGPGIPQEYLDKVFDKFFRVPSHDRHNVKGYGLGLSYAALVMTQHGGKITVSNNSEGGCTFTLLFRAA